MARKWQHEPRASCNPWEQEDTIAFVDTDRDTNIFRLVGGVVHLEVNGRRVFHDVLTYRIDGRTLHVQTADAKMAVLTVPRGNEEVVLRVVALLGRRFEIDSMVQFSDTDGDVNLFRLVPTGCLELFINGKQCMSDVTSCRLDGPNGRTLCLKGSSARAKTITTIPQEKDEALQRVFRIFRRRGLRENMVEFLDTRGDAYTFRLNGPVGTLELYLNGQLCERDLSELRGDGLDGRRLHYSGAGARTSTTMTLPLGTQELALGALALFRRRIVDLSRNAVSIATFCLCPSLDEKSPAGKTSPIKGTITEEDRASSSTSLESSITLYSTLSSSASTGQSSADIAVQQSGGQRGKACPSRSDSCTSLAKTPSEASVPGKRTLVRDWLLRKPEDDFKEARVEQRESITKSGRNIHWLVP